MIQRDSTGTNTLTRVTGWKPRELMGVCIRRIPRQINNLATACLLMAATENATRISDAVLQQTLHEFHMP